MSQDKDASQDTSIKLSALETDLTVPQLAYLIWLLVQHCVIQIPARQATKFFKIIAAALRTAHQTSISWDSLSSKYYTPDPTARPAIKNLLTKMIKTIDADEAKAFK